MELETPPAHPLPPCSSTNTSSSVIMYIYHIGALKNPISHSNIILVSSIRTCSPLPVPVVALLRVGTKIVIDLPILINQIHQPVVPLWHQAQTCPLLLLERIPIRQACSFAALRGVINIPLHTIESFAVQVVLRWAIMDVVVIPPVPALQSANGSSKYLVHPQNLQNVIIST